MIRTADGQFLSVGT